MRQVELTFKSHIGDLARSNIAATLRYRYTRHIVIVADEKLLMSCLQIFDHNIAADRVNHVNAIRMYA